jgi:hypothetical protein
MSNKIDYSLLQLPKGKPAKVVRTEKKARNRSAWTKTKKKVDAAQGNTCFVTGVTLQSKNEFAIWTFTDRHHLEMRSRAKKRIHDETNVLKVSRGVAGLIHGGRLKLLTKRGTLAKSVDAIDHVAWNREFVPIGSEPVQIRPGLAVREIGRD